MNIFIISAGLTLVILGLIMTFQHSSQPPDKIVSTEEPDISKEPAISEEMVETAVPEPSLSERIRSLGNMWEEQRKETQEYHNQNYKQYAAIIINLMGQLGVEKSEVKTKFPENTVLLMEASVNGEMEIRIERRESN